MQTSTTWFRGYMRSSIGAKHVMAVTGILLVLFTIQHMTGHLVMFLGQDAYNDYAHWAQNLGHGSVKWLLRGGLLGLLLVHAVVGIRLAAHNRAARPVAYRMYKTRATSRRARAMAYTGIASFAFLTFHILHFTVGVVRPEHFHVLDSKGRYDAYTMFVRGFQDPLLLATYLAGMLLLTIHLTHGISSSFQSLGIDHPKYRGWLRRGPALAVVLFAGFALPPLAVAIGVIA